MTRSSDLAMAVEHALRAPSVHNTQPWRWRFRAGGVDLYADRGRHLAATDPDGRDLLLSCGAALHHLRVALAAGGLAVAVERTPDPEDADHLATVTITAGPPDPADAALFREIPRRRTDRRRATGRYPPSFSTSCLPRPGTRAPTSSRSPAHACTGASPSRSPTLRSGSGGPPATPPSCSSGPAGPRAPGTAWAWPASPRRSMRASRCAPSPRTGGSPNRGRRPATATSTTRPRSPSS
jgi:hypothetical protein